VAGVALCGVLVGVVISTARHPHRTELLPRAQAEANAQTWLSATKSAQELNRYFDAQPGGKHARSSAAQSRPNSRRVQQMLRSYSAKQSAADLDSYFATLPGQGSHAVLPAKKKSRSVSNDGLPVLPKQDRAKKTRQQRTKVSDDGLPVLKKRSQTPAMQAADKEHEENKQELQAYKFQNPSFKDKLDKVHKMWLKKHDNLPASKSEKREYSALVAKVVGDIGEIVKKGVEHGAPPPGVLKRQIAAAQDKFRSKHKHVSVK